MTERTNSTFRDRLFQASAVCWVLLAVLYWLQFSFWSFVFLALGLITFLAGVSLTCKFSENTLRIIDVLYYGIAILGVIFLFEAQRAERNAASPKLRLVTIEPALEIALTEESKLERISKNPNDEIASSINATLKGLYNDADERFDYWCELAKDPPRRGPPPSPEMVCQKRGEYTRIRRNHLELFRKATAASLNRISDSIDLRTAASSNPTGFFHAASAIRDEARDPYVPLLTTTAEEALVDLELALSVQAGTDHFRKVREANHADLRALQAEKRSLEAILEREVAAPKRSRLNALIQLVIYNIWPYLLVLALSIKLARTLQD